jgi:hypothetical protein
MLIESVPVKLVQDVSFVSQTTTTLENQNINLILSGKPILTVQYPENDPFFIRVR